MNPADALARIRIVLSHPSHPGNVGAAARALKTMGLSRLYLVSPRAFPHPEATARASGAAEVLEAAVVCGDTAQALAGTVFSAALTARRRDLAVSMKWAREAAADLVAAAAQGEVALLFGAESHGLSNAELALCQLPVMIPANPEYSSLNLAAAVQLMCYELRLAALPGATAPQVEFEPAGFDEVEGLVRHLERAVIASGFLDPASPKRFLPRMRRLFARARLEKEEVAILRGVLGSLEKKS